jgi:uracil-DNA glycosylase family 4
MSAENDELAALAQALHKSVQRRQRFGIRRSSPGPAAPASPHIESQPAQGQAPQPPPALTADASAAQPLQPTPADQTAKALACLNTEQLSLAAGQCQACTLHTGRQQPVFSDGAPEPGHILFLGESPSPEDNRTGNPFSGPAGQLLTDIIVKGMGLDRQKVTITHLMKCPTPGGRAPSDEEIALCSPWFQRQLDLASPAVLVPLGALPSNFLLGTNSPLAEIRDQVFERQGRQIVPTFSPAQLLQEAAKKRDCWSDIQRAMAAADTKKAL